VIACGAGAGGRGAASAAGLRGSAQRRSGAQCGPEQRAPLRQAPEV